MIAERTDCRLTRDLMLEAVPYRHESQSMVGSDEGHQDIRILLLTSLLPVRLDPWALYHIRQAWSTSAVRDSRIIREIMDVRGELYQV